MGGVSIARNAIVCDKGSVISRCGIEQQSCERKGLVYSGLLELLIGAAGFADDSDEEPFVHEAVGSLGVRHLHSLQNLHRQIPR
jgi:hypothetical protein